MGGYKTLYTMLINLPKTPVIFPHFLPLCHRILPILSPVSEIFKTPGMAIASLALVGAFSVICEIYANIRIAFVSSSSPDPRRSACCYPVPSRKYKWFCVALCLCLNVDTALWVFVCAERQRHYSNYCKFKHGF